MESQDLSISSLSFVSPKDFDSQILFSTFVFLFSQLNCDCLMLPSLVPSFLCLA